MKGVTVIHGRGVTTSGEKSNPCHSGMVRWQQTSDTPLRIGESRDSGFDATHPPRNDVVS
jgi:hypothetical protein